mmetsp:Transcript_122743/g.342013  ORF Transcript_122743/g.342013 Transcript_122743/m.342013 type:complete len:242 (+) Transcript_122743:199-924(+)
MGWTRRQSRPHSPLRSLRRSRPLELPAPALQVRALQQVRTPQPALPAWETPRSSRTRSLSGSSMGCGSSTGCGSWKGCAKGSLNGSLSGSPSGSLSGSSSGSLNGFPSGSLDSPAPLAQPCLQPPHLTQNRHSTHPLMSVAATVARRAGPPGCAPMGWWARERRIAPWPQTLAPASHVRWSPGAPPLPSLAPPAATNSLTSPQQAKPAQVPLALPRGSPPPCVCSPRLVCGEAAVLARPDP